MLDVLTLLLALGAQAPSRVDPCVVNADALTTEPFVLAAVPAAGARVKGTFTASGCSRTFESSFVWRLYVRGGAELARGIGKGGGVDGPAPFSFTVTATVTKPTLAYLELYEVNAAGGPPVTRVIVPVVVTP